MKGVNQHTAGWATEEIERLKCLVGKGLDNESISAILGRSKKSVAVKKSRLGFKYEQNYEKYNDKEWLHKKYVIEGNSTIDIGEIAGVHFSTIAKWLKAHKLPVRGFYERTLRQREKISNKHKLIPTEKHSCWKGGRTKTNEGYVYVRNEDHPFSNANKSVLEHRLEMEKHLNRYLTKKEVVHHKNEIRDDNRIENLFLFCTSADHMHYHARIKKDSNFPMMYKYNHLHEETKK